MPRRIDDIHPEGFVTDRRIRVGYRPKRRSGRRNNCDPSFPLLGHPVHLRRPFVNIPDLVALACVIQNPFRRRRLPRVDMGNYPNIPHPIQRHIPVRSLNISCSHIVLISQKK